jgi:hypothetical protein
MTIFFSKTVHSFKTVFCILCTKKQHNYSFVVFPQKNVYIELSTFFSIYFCFKILVITRLIHIVHIFSCHFMSCQAQTYVLSHFNKNKGKLDIFTIFSLPKKCTCSTKIVIFSSWCDIHLPLNHFESASLLLSDYTVAK